jgi:hypothetical protein
VLEELNKIPTFPRKALEADFNLYSKLSDRELSAMDMLHKYSWLKVRILQISKNSSIHFIYFFSLFGLYFLQWIQKPRLSLK